MKTFTHTNNDGFDLVHILGTKDNYIITESNGTITYTSESLQRTYIVSGNEEINFKRPDSQGKLKFKWDEEFTPFSVSPLVTSLDPFNDGSLYSKYTFEGNGNDLKNNHNGSVSNVTFSEGKFGQCMITNEDVQAGLNTGINPSTWKNNVRSIGFLVYRVDNDNLSLGGNHALTQTQDTVLFDINNDYVRYYQIEDNTHTASTIFTSNSTIPVGEWSYIMATWTGNNIVDTASIYINGVLSNSTTLSSNFSFNEASSFSIGNIGVYNSKSGKFDTVDLFNKALSGAEALQIANAYIG